MKDPIHLQVNGCTYSHSAISCYFNTFLVSHTFTVAGLPSQLFWLILFLNIKLVDHILMTHYFFHKYFFYLLLPKFKQTNYSNSTNVFSFHKMNHNTYFFTHYTDFEQPHFTITHSGFLTMPDKPILNSVTK